MTQIEKKAGHLDPNETFFIQAVRMPRNAKPANKEGDQLVECKMLSDSDGSTRSKCIETGGIFYPLFESPVFVTP